MTPTVTVALLLCAAYSVDKAYLCARAAEQQNNADAAALAGAIALQESDVTSVFQRTRLVLSRNQRVQGFSSIEDQVVEVGAWDSVNQVFTPMEMLDRQNQPFAVRVRAMRKNIPLFFARLMGTPTADIQREAISVGGRPCRGIWGLNGISVLGNLKVDGYDSTRHDYDPKRSGDVCSGRGIDAKGVFDISGDVMIGLGYSVHVGGATRAPSGVTTTTLSGMDAPDLDLSNIQSLTNNGDLSLTGQQSVLLDPSNALFDSISIRDGAAARIDTPTTVYILGDLDAAGKGFVNTARDPANLTIIVLGKHVALGAASDFYGTLIAPNAHVILSGTHDLFGMVIGKTVEVRGDIDFHIDASLPAHDLIKPPMPVLVK
jgi:hypothetical protein